MRELSGTVVSRVAGRGRALGDPTRIRILAALTRGELAVGQIARTLDSQQSTVSRHLQVLFNGGLVHRRRDASTVVYSLASADVLECIRLLGLPQRRQPPA